MNAKQFAWLYLVENGEPGEPCFYGGVDIDASDVKRFPNLKKCGLLTLNRAIQKCFREEILTVGVDWDKTDSPKSDRVSQFTDTFHDPEYKEMVLGVLVLKNGVKQKWCADSIEVTNVFEMMASAAEAAQKFQDIFGK